MMGYFNSYRNWMGGLENVEIWLAILIIIQLTITIIILNNVVIGTKNK